MSSEGWGAHVRANGIRQHYLRFPGEGAPLIVLPGITSPAATWAFVGRRLAAFSDVYILDIRGRGLSESGPHLDYGLDACAADVREFARALSLERFAVLGHSMGGRIAARFAARPQTPLERVILADPPVSGPGRRPYGKPLAFYLEAIEQARSGLLDAQGVRATYPAWTEEQLLSRAEWLHTCDPPAVAQSWRSFHEEEIHGNIGAIAVAAMLLVAERGNVIDEPELEELARIQPRMTIRKVATGHMMPFDDLEAFLAPVEGFLASR
ncbi:MAG TPA: alpha/beta hydrolase [Ramlibacter sp.]|uniref:alpha/beta fold hydrolase n=1 Tax=Ramlibacter sp. TaxID=1917967 RepID=UPI002C6EB76A|nr:alpha/beta hydrolase [Ramlibacter sp.]HVZ43553.1 alpha/beta hydrolase [Ramlibacter sp.]